MLEQYSNNRIYRPRGKYIGPLDLHYVADRGSLSREGRPRNAQSAIPSAFSLAYVVLQRTLPTDLAGTRGMSPEARRRGASAPDERPRKDRLIQTRVPRDLESTLKREARRRRLTVSHLIRNVLEDTFQLVDDVVANVDEIVTDSVELARRVGRDARRMADAVREAVVESDPGQEGEAAAERGCSTSAASLATRLRLEPRRANRTATCARCATELARGSARIRGSLRRIGGAATWLCARCGSRSDGRHTRSGARAVDRDARL